MVSGHSLSSRPNELLSEQLAASLNKNFQWQIHTDAGATINYRVGNPTDSPPWSGFRRGITKTGYSDINFLDEWRTPTAVSGGKYTHLLITERHDFMGCLQWEDTRRRFKVYYDAFMARSPQAKVYLWSCWLPPQIDPLINHTTARSWIAYEKVMQKVWDGLTARMNLTLQNQGAEHRVRNAPASWVLAKVIEAALDGAAPGISASSSDVTMQKFFRDGVHIDGPLGHYFMAVMEHMVVFRTSAEGGWYPTSGTWPGNIPAAVTALEAATLQSLCWQFFREYHEVHEWTPTMEELRSYTVNEACPAWEAHTRSNGDENFFGARDYSSGNPFVFEASTDSSAGGWFVSP
jgi:hypothetical protein